MFFMKRSQALSKLQHQNSNHSAEILEKHVVVFLGLNDKHKKHCGSMILPILIGSLAIYGFMGFILISFVWSICDCETLEHAFMVHATGVKTEIT